MSIQKTTALVLKSIKWSETSRIVTLYTRKCGKIKVIAKGVHRPKSKFLGNLELFSHIAIVFYKKERKEASELNILSSSELISPFSKISITLKKMALASAVVELVDKLVTGEEPHIELFDLILNTLESINRSDEKILDKLFWWYVLKLMDILGYRPKFDMCVSCEKKIKDEKILFSPERGGIICPACTQKNSFYLRLTKKAVGIGRKLQIIDLKNLYTYKISKGDVEQLKTTLMDFLAHHPGIGKDLKSLEFLKKIS